MYKMPLYLKDGNLIRSRDEWHIHGVRTLWYVLVAPASLFELGEIVYARMPRILHCGKGLYRSYPIL